MTDDKISDLNTRLSVLTAEMQHLRETVIELRAETKTSNEQRQADRKWWLAAIAIPTINVIVLFALNGGFNVGN